jgi:hypothetical protein
MRRKSFPERACAAVVKLARKCWQLPRLTRIELRRSGQLGSSLFLGRAREIRTQWSWGCKLSHWRLDFLNHTKTIRYEALEKKAVSEPKIRYVNTLQYS